MKNREVVKKRFIEESLPRKLGHLASNLSRISFFSQTAVSNKRVIYDVLEESKFFIEWIVPETDIEVAGWLAQIQINLSLWQLNWPKQMQQPCQIRRVSELTNLWSAQLLKRAGLL